MELTRDSLLMDIAWAQSNAMNQTRTKPTLTTTTETRHTLLSRNKALNWATSQKQIQLSVIVLTAAYVIATLSFYGLNIIFWEAKPYPAWLHEFYYASPLFALISIVAVVRQPVFCRIFITKLETQYVVFICATLAQFMVFDAVSIFTPRELNIIISLFLEASTGIFFIGLLVYTLRLQKEDNAKAVKFCMANTPRYRTDTFGPENQFWKLSIMQDGQEVPIGTNYVDLSKKPLGLSVSRLKN